MTEFDFTRGDFRKERIGELRQELKALQDEHGNLISQWHDLEWCQGKLREVMVAHQVLEGFDASEPPHMAIVRLVEGREIMKTILGPLDAVQQQEGIMRSIRELQRQLAAESNNEDGVQLP